MIWYFATSPEGAKIRYYKDGGVVYSYYFYRDNFQYVEFELGSKNVPLWYRNNTDEDFTMDGRDKQIMLQWIFEYRYYK